MSYMCIYVSNVTKVSKVAKLSKINDLGQKNVYIVKLRFSKVVLLDTQLVICITQMLIFCNLKMHKKPAEAGLFWVKPCTIL